MRIGGFESPNHAIDVIRQREIAHVRAEALTVESSDGVDEYHFWVAHARHGWDRVGITLFFILWDGASWSYKPISEEMGPFALDCPPQVLAVADPTDDDTAAEWRAVVRSEATSH